MLLKLATLIFNMLEFNVNQRIKCFEFHIRLQA